MKSKAIFSLLLIVSFPLLLSAQLNHFLYLQTEGKQPFYAKIDKKIFSSSVAGYLIIPKLKDGTFNITIGFPKGEIEEQIFQCAVSKDAGYLIKKFGDKGWGLFNLQSLDVVMAGSSQPGAVKTAAKEKTDEFSSMLSEVVNDPSIKQQEKTETAVKTTEQVKETPVAQKQEEKAPLALQSNRSVVVKSRSHTTSEGLELVYIDITGDHQDTVSVLILIGQEQDKTESSTSPAVQQNTSADISRSSKEPVEPGAEPKREVSKVDEQVQQTAPEPPVTEKKEEAAEEKKFLPIEIKANGKDENPPAANSAPPMINSDCKAYATEEDFLKLRKKMVAEDSDDGMIAAAQKFLKSKCYTVEQVKNLAVLFLKDQGKYKFFDASYAFVSDSHNFHTLENLLSDPYFITRFKAMVRH
jgi:Domain of unknown function (DUF4476)